MNVQTSFPVFESGQVLGSRHLNDAVEYLEQQERLTRSKLVGAGIVCGLGVDVVTVAGATQVRISSGVAITSEGYLLAEPETRGDRARRYTPPTPMGEAHVGTDAARYPYLFLGGEQPIEAWELLAVGDTVAPGEVPPIVLDGAFLDDKTVMLFLECDLHSVKSCDINDCSDKGAEMRFTIRRLLVSRTHANETLALEQTKADRPAARSEHPRLRLPHLRIEKLNPGHAGIGSFPQFYARVLEVAMRLGSDLADALRAGYDAYRYLLSDMFPANRFPTGPFGSHYFANVEGNLLRSPFLIQHFYDYLLDVARAHYEFVEAAAQFDAQCQPNGKRFPKHVLLGDATAKPQAFGASLSAQADFDAYDPKTASTGLGPNPSPAPRRHHFVPAPALDGGANALAELRSMFYRLTLLAHSYDTKSLLVAPVRITPSRDGASPLAERAIPYYYAADRNSDLFRNWSHRKTRTNLLATVYSYHLNPPDGDHPLWYRLDEQEFFRVEGLVGKPLGSTMATLVQWKRAQGLDFAIEPVWMGLGLKGDALGSRVDEKSRQLAFETFRKLLLCRMGDLDVIFLMLMAAIITFIIWLIRSVGRQVSVAAATGAELVTVRESTPPPMGTRVVTDLFTTTFAGRLRPIAVDIREEEILRVEADRIVATYRHAPFKLGDLTANVVKGEQNEVVPETSYAAVYSRVKDDAAGGSLFDRTQAHVASMVVGGDLNAAVKSAYNGVSLIDRAEKLMQVAAAPSIADFDVQGFSTAFRGFADSYARYADASVIDESVVGSTAATANLGVRANAGMIAANARAFSVANIMGELTRRLQSLFADLTLSGFARRHPGLEHKCGVPVGGTLVLAYASKDELAALLDKTLSAATSRVASVTHNLGSVGSIFAASASAAAAELESASARRTDDPLDDFVVLADFCLAHQCCETGCSDVEIVRRFEGGVFDDVAVGAMRVDPVFPGEVSSTETPSPDRPTDTPPDRPPDRPTDTPPDRPTDTPPDRPTDTPPDRPTAETAGVAGTVFLASSGGRRKPLPQAKVQVQAEDGTKRVHDTDDRGRFKIKLAAGVYELRGQASGLRGKAKAVTLEPGQRVTVELTMARSGGPRDG